MDIIRKKSTRNVKRNLEASLRQAPNSAKERPDWNQDFPAKKKRKIWKKLLIIFVILVLLGSLGALGGYFYVKTTPLSGENSGRINIMVLGVDNAAQLSDTIMIVSIDTRAGHEPKLAMISLPRDLYVQIPQMGGAKINSAYSYGVNTGDPNGGVELAKQTIEENFDLKIDHYAILNFDGLKDLVDAVGGVDVDVKESINDPFFPKPDYSGVVNFQITRGVHHMDGDLALRYTRSRYTTSDFDRAARQQQVMVALKDKITSPTSLLVPGRINTLRDAVDKNLKTDLSFRQMLKLYLIFRSVEQGNVTRHVIDSSNYLVPANFGGAAFVPRTGDFDELNEFIENIFSQQGNTLPEAQQD